MIHTGTVRFQCMKIRTEIHENRARSFVAMKHAARGSVRVLALGQPEMGPVMGPILCIFWMLITFLLPAPQTSLGHQ